MTVLSWTRLRPVRQDASKTSISFGCTVGPTSKVSLSEIFVDNFAEASKTALTFVVELEALYTACIGR